MAAGTPFIKARGRPGPFTPVDLAVAMRPAVAPAPALCPRNAFDEVILGCVNVIADESQSGAGRRAAAWHGRGNAGVHRADQLRLGHAVDRHRLTSTSRRPRRSGAGWRRRRIQPLAAGLPPKRVDWFAGLAGAAIFCAPEGDGRLPAVFLKPVIGLERGLTDPVVELNMGQTAEVLAHLFDISRHDADTYAVESHHRLARAQERGIVRGRAGAGFRSRWQGL